MTVNAYDPKMDSYWGLCPRCAEEGRFEEGHWLNVHRSHWIVCRSHEVRWAVGWNLSDCWREETEETWERNADELEQCEEVAVAFVDEYPELLAKRKWLHEQLSDLADPGFPEEECPF